AKNLTMRVESLQSRLEFNERRARALESVVVYKGSESETLDSTRRPPISDVHPVSELRPPSELRPRSDAPPPAPQAQISAGAPTQVGAEGPGQRSRRRRRRRGRRGGGAPVSGAPTVGSLPGQAAGVSDAAPRHDQPTDDTSA